MVPLLFGHVAAVHVSGVKDEYAVDIAGVAIGLEKVMATAIAVDILISQQ